MQEDCNAELINLLHLAMLSSSTGGSAVVDFAVEHFRRTGYVHRNRVAQTRKDLPLLICGEWRHAKTDVCIVDLQKDDILLLVQEDKRLEDRKPVDAHAQLVAQALAAFTENNANRQSMGLPPLDSKVNHPRNCHGWHCADVLQDPCYRGTRDPCSTWDLPSDPYHHHLLSPPRTTPSSPPQ
ncbi:hypothetical protein BJ165DRAFT_1338197 [Panaeolus papilionaceus]|nr:hypothetical protein BJ165DRAFT_1338197 [Panaeolus papilionaceus]